MVPWLKQIQKFQTFALELHEQQGKILALFDDRA